MFKRIFAAPLDTLPAAHDPRARMIGIGLICAALVCFACLDTIAKWLTNHLPTLEVVWARYASHFFLSMLIVNPWTLPGLLSTKKPWLQIGRSTLLFASTALNFVALHYLQLDQTATIAFTAPFFIALLAGPLLGEWIHWRRWTAIIVGFCGVLLVMRPGAGEGIHPVFILSLLSTLCYAFYNLSTRFLAGYDTTGTTMFYTALVGFIAASIPLPYVWSAPTDPLVIAGMLAVGTFGFVGHLFLVLAHRYAPAAVLAPFTYTQIVWYVAGGFLVFGDVPTSYTLAGAAVVIASGLYLLYRERKVKGEL
ncbi:MAG TPA: DMT family transporter [Xanthobacteraceae bacterium]|nr:DMT family transporter [Xanthobacteraceae bacterium]